MAPQQNPLASYDLHLHTYWSYDASASPATYFKRAAVRQMRCIAITEHHVLDSQDEIDSVAQQYPAVRWLRAGEFTVNTSLGAVDLVCLGFPRHAPPALRRVLDMYHDWQRAAGQAITRGMTALGLGYTDDDRRALLRDYRPARTIRRQGYTHVRNGAQRAWFLRRGLISTPGEYGGLLRRIGQTSGLPPYPDVAHVVPVFKQLGVLVAIAHPHGPCRAAERKRMDTVREECQLDGMECAHTSMPPELSAAFRAYCVGHGMVSTAGSDCHLDHEIDTCFARHGGREEWLDELLERMD